MKTQVSVSSGAANCCDSESKRYALGGILVSPNGKGNCVYLTATDGRCMAVTKVDGRLADGPEIMPMSVAKHTRKTRGMLVTRTDSGWENERGQEAGIEEGRFPNTASVWPKELGAHTVRIDANLLANVANTIGDGQVVLYWDDNGPITIANVASENGEYDENVGLLMPLDADDNTTHRQSTLANVQAYVQSFDERKDR